MKLTPKQIAWLSGAEKAIIAGIVTGILQYHIEGGLPTTKAGWLKFCGGIAGCAYTAIRLYLNKSPLTGVFDMTGCTSGDTLTPRPPAPPRN